MCDGVDMGTRVEGGDSWTGEVDIGVKGKGAPVVEGEGGSDELMGEAAGMRLWA